MPTYVYRFVDSGETIEVQQSFTDDALTEAVDPTDGTLRPVKKVYTPVGITFKGNGFYKTDSRGKNGAAKAASPSSSSDSSSSSSTSDSKPAADKKSDSSSSTSTPSSTSSSSSSDSGGTKKSDGHGHSHGRGSHSH